MSAESLADPAYVYKNKDIDFISWGNLSTDEKSYYMRFMNDMLTADDDEEDEQILMFRRLEYLIKEDGGLE